MTDILKDEVKKIGSVTMVIDCNTIYWQVLNYKLSDKEFNDLIK